MQYRQQRRHRNPYALRSDTPLKSLIGETRFGEAHRLSLVGLASEAVIRTKNSSDGVLIVGSHHLTTVFQEWRAVLGSLATRVGHIDLVHHDLSDIADGVIEMTTLGRWWRDGLLSQSWLLRCGPRVGHAGWRHR